MIVFLKAVRDVLYGGRAATVKQILMVIVVCSGLYGAAIGVFGAMYGRPIMMLVTAIKVPLALMLTFFLSMPSFLVFNGVFGLRDDTELAVQALVRMMAAGTITLASLAPVTLLWYASSKHYEGATLFNMLMFSIAGLVSAHGLRKLYAPLIKKDRRHKSVLWIWKFSYSFICLQVFWIFRPFLGDPSRPIRLFRDSAFGNVYTELWNKVWMAF